MVIRPNEQLDNELKLLVNQEKANINKMYIKSIELGILFYIKSEIENVRKGK